MDIWTEGGVYIPKADEIEMRRATGRMTGQPWERCSQQEDGR